MTRQNIFLLTAFLSLGYLLGILDNPTKFVIISASILTGASLILYFVLGSIETREKIKELKE